MKHKVYYLAVLAVLFSCKKDQSTETNVPKMLNELSVRDSKIYFAKALAATVSNEPSVRSLIKTEALKQFDNDYDVFYQTVRNVTLPDGESFEQKLVKHASSKDSLDLAIKTLPLLTILVPEIGDISAEKWNETTEIPLVAVEPTSYSTKENIKAFFGKDKNFEIPYGSVPEGISLVVKDNERVIVNNGSSLYTKGGLKNVMVQTKNVSGNYQSSEKFLTTNNMTFSFADKVFDNVHKVAELKTINKTSISPITGPVDDNWRFYKNNLDKILTTPRVVQHILDAYDSKAEWQRDNVYYGLNPSTGVTRGTLKPLIKECITSLRFQTPEETFSIIGKNPGDPVPVDDTPIAQQWTDGSYEFRLTALINSKNGGGAEVHQTFYVKPSKLFVIHYDSGKGGAIPFRVPRVQEVRRYIFPTPIPLEAWDLSNVSYSWSIFLLKYNNQATTTDTYTSTNTYSTNFEFNPILGTTEKIGFKFGVTATTTNTQTSVISRTFGSSDFGNAIVSFSDPIYKSYFRYDSNPDYEMYYTPYEIAIGPAFITMEPRKVM